MLPQPSKWGGANRDFKNGNGDAFDVEAYSAAGYVQKEDADPETYPIKDNLWAPDVIWNPTMEKWCMYLSINGQNANCSIVLLTSDNIEGPYLYEGPVVFSGFNIGSSQTYKSTDLEIALGTQASLPSRYAVGSLSGWRQRWPNAIDPCVFYDEDGKLWMSYGSWHGGIFMLELDEKTGLRDYDVTYTYTQGSSDDDVREDPYFGKKIAGGRHVSGEASYIKYIDGYYYLYVTYGGLNVADGYQMRVFRSTSPTGPYNDPYNGDGVAIYPEARVNYGKDGTRKTNRGVNIFGAYGDWGFMATGDDSERSQGHNSVITNGDQTFMVYHTRFQNRTIVNAHELRVHQVFKNSDGWLCAAPFEYTGETVTNTQIKTTQQVATANIPGNYKILLHDKNLDHANKQLKTPLNIELKSDGTIVGDKTGTWSVTAGTSYISIKIDENSYQSTYNGVLVEQTMEPTDVKVIAFTAMNRKKEDRNSGDGGNTIWGYKVPSSVKSIGAVGNNWKTSGSSSEGYLFPTGKTITFKFSVDDRGDGDSWKGYLGIISKTSTNTDLNANIYTFLRSMCDYNIKGGDWNQGALYNENNYPGDDAAAKETARKAFLKGSMVTMQMKRVGTRVAISVDIQKDGTKYRHYYSQDLGTKADVYASIAADFAKLTLMEVKTTDNDPLETTLIGEFGCNSSFTSFSDYYRLMPEQSLKLKFKNYNPQILNWNNFIAYVTSDADRDTSTKYYGLRADNYVNEKGVAATKSNYEVFDWDWTKFRELMDGAEIELTVTRTGSSVKMRADITPANGTTPFYEEYSAACGDGKQPVRVYLTTQNAYLGLVSAEVGATISAYDWSTFVNGNALDLTNVDGLTAYAVTGHDGANINKVEVASAVPANTPLLLKGDANTTYFIPVVASGTAPAVNLLKAGTGESVEPESGKTKYALSVEAGAAHFKKIEADRAIPVGKA